MIQDSHVVALHISLRCVEVAACAGHVWVSGQSCNTTSLATAVSLNLLSECHECYNDGPGHTRSLRWLRRSIWSSGARPFSPV